MADRNSELGMQIKLMRIARKLNQTDFASLCGLSRPTLIAAEKYGVVSIETQVKVFRACGEPLPESVTETAAVEPAQA